MHPILETTLWAVMLGGLAVGLWPTNLAGAARRATLRGWERRGGPTRLDRLTARSPMVAAVVVFALTAGLLWRLAGLTWALLVAAVHGVVAYAFARAARDLQRQWTPGSTP